MKYTYLVKIVYFLVVFFLFSSLGHARLASHEESSMVVKDSSIKRIISKNGTFDLFYSIHMEIKKNSARKKYGLYRIKFNPNAEKIIYIKAKTINKNKTIEVKKKNIVIKPLASRGPGFDTKSLATIAFPDVQIGSILVVEYHKKRFLPILEGSYSDLFERGSRNLIEKHREEWVSKDKLYFEIYDPKKFYQVEKSDHRIVINLKRPLFSKIVEEPNSLYDQSESVWYAVSTMKSWKDFPLKTINYYEKIINSKLPPLLRLIYNEAIKIISPEDQIDFITSELANKIRYLGDWRPIKGAYHPRTLNEITDSRYADCKDFSVAMASILRKIGYNTHVAITNRGRKFYDAPINLPINAFNHAIVWASKNNKTYWIDPTNNTSYSKGIFHDIEKRNALILRPSGSTYVKIPQNKSVNSKIFHYREFNLDRKSEIKGSARIKLEGSSSRWINERGLNSSKDEINFIIAKWVTEVPDLRKWNFKDYEINKRIIKDFETEFQFKGFYSPMLTSLGKAIHLPTLSIVKKLNIDLTERHSSLFLRNAHQFHSETLVKGKNFKVNKGRKCSGTSQWFDYHRDTRKKGNDVLIKEFIDLKVTSIPIKDLKSKKYKTERDKILNCLNDYALIY